MLTRTKIKKQLMDLKHWIDTEDNMKYIILFLTIFSGNSFAQGDIIVNVATKALAKVESDFVRDYKACKGTPMGSKLSYWQMPAMRIDTPNNDLKNYTVLVPYNVNCWGIAKAAFATINVEIKFTPGCDSHEDQCWVADPTSIKAVEFRAIEN